MPPLWPGVLVSNSPARFITSPPEVTREVIPHGDADRERSLEELHSQLSTRTRKGRGEKVKCVSLTLYFKRRPGYSGGPAARSRTTVAWET
jgi:hypothetical protein